MIDIRQGDCMDVLPTLPAGHFHTCVTSPPYWGLRDYGVEGQLGLEATPEQFVDNLVVVFREVRRVLRDDGTVWLNLGDSYTGSGKGGNPDAGKQATNKGSQSIGTLYGKTGESARQAAVTNVSRRLCAEHGMKPKDLVGIPWRVAFALQADGWYLRSDVIWSKSNPMPESVRDRPTRAHEMIFLLSKRSRYFYDADAIREGPSQARVIERPDLVNQIRVFLDHFRFQDAGADAVSLSVSLAASILQRSEMENDLRLTTLDAKVGHQCGDNSASSLVAGVPIIRRAAAEAARFADGDIAAKDFLSEIYGLWVALPDGDHFKEAWRTPVSDALIDAYRNGAIRIHDSGEVGQLDLSTHHQQDTSGATPASRRNGTDKQRGHRRRHDGFNDRWDSMSQGEQQAMGANKRTVWTIATQPSPLPHFATFPEALVKPCILAGSPETCCAECGAPPLPAKGTCGQCGSDLIRGPLAPVPGRVLDIFAGTGTVGVVSQKAGRSATLIELSPEYVEIMERRLAQRALL